MTVSNKITVYIIRKYIFILKFYLVDGPDNFDRSQDSFFMRAKKKKA